MENMLNWIRENFEGCQVSKKVKSTMGDTVIVNDNDVYVLIDNSQRRTVWVADFSFYYKLREEFNLNYREVNQVIKEWLKVDLGINVDKYYVTNNNTVNANTLAGKLGRRMLNVNKYKK